MGGCGRRCLATPNVDILSRIVETDGLAFINIFGKFTALHESQLHA